ncbi:putative F-box domain, leucine-rich repeat domain, L domain-containing protein [Rosa chinensis]|uniref:Putative F-box domain, leucine-rich repeat domain, L domain-containing protein n=1 Tax=Rosa chinensis TaxID=74649 RepID=A0A2P6RC08_ROSCH|nr:putative F-box/LRR-repeat protein At3g58880 [Rosa chinensis]PRQ43969.1 putative F-box domain, leucine-rich repeat domain, L domain-containing protein [Rosa chinensis]
MEMMKQRRKLASCEGVGGSGGNESGIDRFSDLPDQVAHHILSFLALPDLSRVCCVSKRCGQLCISAPSLNFDEFSSDSMSTCSEQLKLLTYLVRFLFRRGDNKIQSFRVRWEIHSMHVDATSCICDTLSIWIQNAVGCNVEVLDLKITSCNTKLVFFPSCVFLCAPLKSLVVDMNYTVLRTPSSAFSSNLKYLQLTNVYIEDEEFFKWISCSCKCIGDLSLSHVHGIENVTIFRSSLERFSLICGPLDHMCHLNISSEKLVDINLYWTFDSPSNKSLTIDAPNLKCFNWIGNLMKYPNLGKLECLETAALYLKPEVEDLNKVHEVLWSLRRAPGLLLNDVVIKASFMDGSVPASLYDTSSLCLVIESFVDELVPALVCVFRRTPNLSLLCIKSKPPHNPQSNTYGFNMEYWKLQDLAFTNQLNHVTIELCSGSNGIELAKYMLKYALNMQRMVVICLPIDLKKVTRKLKKIKMISNAVLVIQKKLKGKRLELSLCIVLFYVLQSLFF